MNVKFLGRAAIARTLKKLMATYDEYYWAVAWGTENKLSDELVDNAKKIKQLIFGTHFYQTDPKLLVRFQDKRFARVMPNDARGTFHPKVYLFLKGNQAAAIVGSANFTQGGVEANNEAALLIEGKKTDGAITDIMTMIGHAWEVSVYIDQEFLDRYRVQYQATARHRKALQKDRKIIKSKPNAKHSGLQLWSWAEYVRRVKNDPYHSFNGRLAVLQEARRLFSRTDHFSGLDENERRALAGFLGLGKEHSQGKKVVDWGWFGSMKGAGDFKSLILDNNKWISAALDYIPLTGELQEEQYANFIDCFIKAFARKSHKGGVATASRLLAMRRPDTFICINSQNRTLLGADLGFAHSTLDFDKYWYNVIEPIMESIWWQSDRPSGEDGKLWDGRAAMLDAIYYEEGR